MDKQMTTRRRELRLRFEEILIPSLSDNPQTEEAENYAKELAERLADAAISIFEEGKKSKPTNDPMWNFLHGIDISQDEIEDNKLAEEAKQSFEMHMKFNPLPWSSTQDWAKFEKFVIEQYKNDKLIFAKYKTWQQGEGKYLAMSNRKIKERPSDFVACFPDFLAHSSMYEGRKPSQSSFVQTDDNDAPISY